jgi:hypothetical protein
MYTLCPSDNFVSSEVREGSILVEDKIKIVA